MPPLRALGRQHSPWNALGGKYDGPGCWPGAECGVCPEVFQPQFDWLWWVGRPHWLGWCTRWVLWVIPWHQCRFAQVFVPGGSFCPQPVGLSIFGPNTPTSRAGTALVQVSPGLSSQWEVSEPEGLWAVVTIHCTSSNGRPGRPQPQPHSTAQTPSSAGGLLCFLRLPWSQSCPSLWPHLEIQGPLCQEL